MTTNTTTEDHTRCPECGSVFDVQNIEYTDPKPLDRTSPSGPMKRSKIRYVGLCRGFRCGNRIVTARENITGEPEYDSKGRRERKSYGNPYTRCDT